MKKILTALMLVLAVALAGCKEKKPFIQSDIKQDNVLAPGQDVDWIGLYLRAHDLDSLKDVAVEGSRKIGIALPALADSVPALWEEWTNLLLLRKGKQAFDLFDSHRRDFADYLRFDFINYGFMTQVYLPYMATVNTKEDYGKICIEELEGEFVKAQQSIMAGNPIPSHYENLLIDLFYAYANFNENDRALTLIDEILAYTSANYGEDSPKYATMLCNKANLCHNMGNSYSAAVAARRAIAIYGNCLSSDRYGEEERAKMIKEKSGIEAKLDLWQQK